MQTELERVIRRENLTYRAAAEKVGNVTGQMIGAIASGKRRPGPDLALRIEKALGISAHVLIFGRPQSDPSHISPQPPATNDGDTP